MFRIALAACVGRVAAHCQRASGLTSRTATALVGRPTTFAPVQRSFSQLLQSTPAATPLLSTQPAILALAPTAVRTVTKFSLKKGKRKTVKTVLKRFMRLDWGGWIRTRQGRHKKMWRKTGSLKRRLRQHVLVNGQQSWLLDKMVTPFWRRPRHYVDDPYRPYHSREEFWTTRKSPIKY